MDCFYEMNIWVTDPEGNAEYYLDENDIITIIPELYKNGKIQYHKISLINLLKIKHIDKDIRSIEDRAISMEKRIKKIEKQMLYLWTAFVAVIAFLSMY